MTFRCSAKSYDVKSCLLAYSLLREYKSRLFSYFLRSLVLKAIIDCFSLYQESIRGFWFSREYVLPTFSQFKMSILKRVCHEFCRAMAAENRPVQTKAKKKPVSTTVSNKAKYH